MWNTTVGYLPRTWQMDFFLILNVDADFYFTNSYQIFLHVS